MQLQIVELYILSNFTIHFDIDWIELKFTYQSQWADSWFIVPNPKSYSYVAVVC